MKTRNFACMALAFLAAACAQAPKPVTVSAAPVPEAAAPPVPLVVPPTAPEIEPAVLAAAQRNLRALGYAAGKPGDISDPVFQRAISAFQKDQGLPEDGHLTAALAERLDVVRAAAAKVAPADGNRNAVFIYSDGAVKRQPLGLLIAPPDGLVSDAPANFLQPLRPGIQASFHLGHCAQNGNLDPAITVTCHAGRIAQENVALGPLDVIAVDCHGDGARPLQWRAAYSTKLGMVVRLENSTGMHDLVAVRPVTSDWPLAARAGLDWALTHTLETTIAAPVQWSSTGVQPHFQIGADGAIVSGHDAGLSGRYAALPCRRFEMVQNGVPALHYPGIACQGADGLWSLPGGNIQLASPANAIASRSAAPARRGLRD